MAQESCQPGSIAVGCTLPPAFSSTQGRYLAYTREHRGDTWLTGDHKRDAWLTGGILGSQGRHLAYRGSQKMNILGSQGRHYELSLHGERWGSSWLTGEQSGYTWLIVIGNAGGEIFGTQRM